MPTKIKYITFVIKTAKKRDILLIVTSSLYSIPSIQLRQVKIQTSISARDMADIVDINICSNIVAV